MPKRIALMDSVTVDDNDLSNFARDVRLTSEHARIDVSGFNATGADEFLAGSTTQSVAVEFYGAYGATETHQVLYPIHQSRSVVAFAWRPDMNTPASATNPELRGNVQVLTYSPGGTRGDADTFSVEFTAADEAGLVFEITPLPEVMAKVVEGVTVSAQGLKGVMLGLHNAGKDTEKFGRAALRKAGDAVKDDAGRRFARYDQRTAGGYRVVVRRTGVSVEQSLRKTTGLRPDFGALQMRKALVPALDENEQETERLLEEAFLVIEERFEATARMA